MMTETCSVLLSVYSCPKPTNVFAFGTTTTSATTTSAIATNINNAIASIPSPSHQHLHVYLVPLPFRCTILAILAKWSGDGFCFISCDRSFIHSFIHSAFISYVCMIRVLYINICMYLFEWREWVY